MRTTVSRMRRWKKHAQLPNEAERGSTHLVDLGPTATQMLAAQDEQKTKETFARLSKGTLARGPSAHRNDLCP